MALYTAANPDVYLQPQYVDGQSNSNNFWIPKGATTNADWGLKPFWKDNTGYWTSQDVRNTDIFGYAYPETQYWKFDSDEQWRNDVRGTIEMLYPNSARNTLINAIASGGNLAATIQGDNSFVDWTIEVTASGMEMPSSFSAQFSLVGLFSSDPSTHVGAWTRMMSEDRETGTWVDHQAARKKKRDSTIVRNLSSTLALTSNLLDEVTAGNLGSLDADVVVPYLKAHLTWNVYAVRQPLKSEI